MRPIAFTLAATLAAAAVGCGAQAGAGARVPAPPRADLGAAFEAAMWAEARDAQAAEGYLDAIDRALAQPADPWVLATVVASLDALVARQVVGLEGGVEHALVHRSRAAMVGAAARLRRAWSAGAAAGPLARGAIAQALHALALRVGDPEAAATWRSRTACAREATVVGPLDAAPLTSLAGPSPVPASGPLAAGYRGVAPFAARVSPEIVHADACGIDVTATSPLRGLRALVLDIEIPRPQTIALGFESSSAARVELGGQALLDRPYGAGRQPALVLATAEAPAGKLRLVARVAQAGDGREVGISAWGEDGSALRMMAPRPGQIAPARPRRIRQVAVVPPIRRERDLVLGACALLGLGRAREAVQLLEKNAPAAASRAPLVDLVRLRAVSQAYDRPRNEARTLVQAAAEAVLARCPACWEARVAVAAATGERRGHAAGRFAALAELLGPAGQAGSKADGAVGDGTKGGGVVEIAYAAGTAYEAGMLDLSEQSYAALGRRAPGSALQADVDERIHRRSGAVLVQAACAGGTSRAATGCLQSHIARADLAGTLAEIRRLRALRGAPDAQRAIELQQLLAHGQAERALRVYQELPPGRRLVETLGAFVAGPQAAVAGKLMSRDMRRARDAPYAFEPVVRLLGVEIDRAPELENEGREIVARDRAEAFLPGAATAVLRHLERYRLDGTGLLHYWVHDLRRVSGTTDVAAGAWSEGPMVRGRAAQRTLRQRIYKRDGRVLDPDPGAGGEQWNTELAQLETGDYVEQIVVGWALPDDAGQIVVDSPDLLPLRTSVREAEIELDREARIPLALWAHALLGEGERRRAGDRLITRWRLRAEPPRRVQEGVPPLEARVAISFGTESWERIARSLGERLTALDEQDPYVARWVPAALARPPAGVGGPAPSPRELVTRLVARVGKQVRRADADALSDFVAETASGPQRETARWILERGSGSRSWVVHRALRELGLRSRIAVAETQPLSSSPHFPAHAGRFRHPLVLVDLPEGRLWIDADVDGPPLPPGTVSPELRGRQALLPDAAMLRVDAEATGEGDEIDIRLRLDERGDGHGTFAALLRGRQAQQLAEALEVTVGSERQQLLRNVVLGWLPWADVREVALSSDEGSWQVGLRAEIDALGYGRAEGRDGTLWLLPGIDPVHAVFPAPRATTLGTRYLAQAERTAALAIDAPLLFHVHRRIELPPAVAVIHPAEALKIETAELEAVRAVTQSGGLLEDDFRLSLPAGTVDLDRLEGFARDVRRVDDGFRYGTRVGPKR